jgi:outer membrane lipoprotein-sorting protein
MHEVEVAPRSVALRPTEMPTLPSRAPDFATLYTFMREAELRFSSLRMRIADERIGAKGEEIETTEVWLRHPGMAKVIQTRGNGMDRDFDIWLSDGETVQTYAARNNVTTRRRAPSPPVGAAGDTSMPFHAQIYLPVTPLPAETLTETFVHPRGFCRNVLATGVTELVGTSVVAGREVLLLRCDHPRTSHVLTDRPDHRLEVAVDFQTGMILLLAEHVGGRITRKGEVTSLSFDETIPDSAFSLHISDDTVSLY